MGAKKRILAPGVGASEIQKERSNGHVKTEDITLSTGVVLRCKAVSRSLFADLLARHPLPKPPVIYLPDKGREEDNPDHPDYIEKVKQHNIEIAKSLSDAMVLLGTEVIDIPKGLPKQDDRDWLEEMRVLGFDLRPGPERYLAWVKFKAVANEGDFNAIGKAVGRQTGVTEEDVESAAQTFRRRPRRR